MKNNTAAIESRHQTRISIRETIIKMIKDDTDTILSTHEYGKLTIIECKSIAKKLGCIYISKELVEDVFYLDTRVLHTLKNNALYTGKMVRLSRNEPYTETTVGGFRYIENDDGSNDAHPDCISEEWRKQMDKDD